MASRLTLAEVVKRLQALYGKPEPPEVTDAWELLLLESVAYLVDDERRWAVFQALKKRLGTSPEALRDAPDELLIALLRDGGMRPPDRAAKLRECAALGLDIGLPALRRQVREAPEIARKALKRFPGIGDPGADRVLLLNRSRVSLAPDSNALRVLTRLGFGDERKDYGGTYRSAADAVRDELPADFDWLIAAHQLLRRHGQELCKRTDPRCGLCPLAPECPAATRAG